MESASNGPVNQHKVLLADNDRLIRETVGDFLRSLKYKVYLAEDGLEAVRLTRKVRPACVILDVIMPKLDGSRVCRVLRHDPRLQEIAIIILSGLSPRDFRTFAGLSGDVYVAKGFLPTVCDNIRRAIEQVVRDGRPDPLAWGAFGYEQDRPNQVVQEMLEERERFAGMLQALGAGVLELDGMGHILMATPGACDILGGTEAQLIGESVLKYCSERSRRELRTLLHSPAAEPGLHPQVLNCRFASGLARLRLSTIRNEGACTGFLMLLENEASRPGEEFPSSPPAHA